jgi:glycosyltransferase involved in cell wall biosynthesis
MRLQIVDPPAYTPPYDRSLCEALARVGADVELVTSPFRWGNVPEANGYEVREMFYRRASRLSPRSRGRRPLAAAEHLTDMLRYRRRTSDRADVSHFQWLTFPRLDAHLLPTGVPLVQTPHGLLREEAWSEGRPFARLLRRMDAIVALSDYGADVARELAGVPADRVRVIPHGAFDYLTQLPEEAALPPELAAVEGPVVLFFGLIRPYKAVDVLLRAFSELEGAELWIVGRPLGVELSELTGLAESSRSTVRFVTRFVDDEEIPALFRRADLVVLPHRDAEQSGVLFTALAFGKPIVMTDVGGFGEMAAQGIGRLVPPEDRDALATAIADLLDDPSERDRLGAAARAAAAGPYSWDAIARQHLALYRELLGN